MLEVVLIQWTFVNLTTKYIRQFYFRSSVFQIKSEPMFDIYFNSKSKFVYYFHPNGHVQFMQWVVGHGNINTFRSNKCHMWELYTIFVLTHMCFIVSLCSCLLSRSQRKESLTEKHVNCIRQVMH